MKSALDIIGKENLEKLRELGFVVIHREPDEDMAKAFYAGNYPESVIFDEGFHRIVACSINKQNAR